MKAFALLLVAAPAAASTVMPLSPAQLAAGADRIEDATVIARWTTRTANAIETHATLDDGIEIVVPGGELGTAREIVFGAPEIVVGERARWFLRERGDGTYRIYGWAQGVVPSYVPPHAEFTTNGMVWPAAKIPVPYLINDQGSMDGRRHKCIKQPPSRLWYTHYNIHRGLQCRQLRCKLLVPRCRPAAQL